VVTFPDEQHHWWRQPWAGGGAAKLSLSPHPPWKRRVKNQGVS